jgi:hypothetical protein
MDESNNVYSFIESLFERRGLREGRSLFERKGLERGDRFLNGRIGERRSLFRTSVNTGRTTAKIFLYQKCNTSKLL